MEAGGQPDCEAEQEAYARLLVLLRLLEGVNERRRDSTGSGSPLSTLYTLTLRAASHPALRPFLQDPLRMLDGAYISLDSQAFALAEAAASAAPTAASWLSPEDIEAFLAAGATLLAPNHSDAEGSTGGFGGAVYVPATSAAAQCRIVAAYARIAAGLQQDLQGGWPAPIPIRPVSAAVRASAERALRAAVTLLCEENRLPTGLFPGPVYFDVCAPALSAAAHANIDGDSLDLPLALAFLSTLTQTAPLPNLYATGALREADTGKFALHTVGHVTEKRGAVPGTLLAPVGTTAAGTGIKLVADLSAAARVAFPQAAAAAHVPVSPPVSGSDVYIVCALPPERSDAAPSLTARRDDLIRGTLQRAGGEVFINGETRTIWYAAFADPVTALNAARQLRQTLLCYGWPTGNALDALLPSLSVQVGGAERLGDGCWIGDAPDQAEHLAEAALPGRLIVSERVYAAATVTAHPAAAPPLTFTLLGTHRLRDLRPPLAVYVLTEPDAPTPTAATTLQPGLGQRPHNLPVQPLPLFGRERERAELRRLLQDPATRMVTLTGPGGCGKSRLAIEAAAASAGSFEGGIYLVSLEDARSADEAAVAIAAALRLPADFAPDHAAAATMAEVIADLTARLPTLLVLDGAEGAAASSPGASGEIAALIQELIRAVPDLVCLVSARTALRTLDGVTLGGIVFPVAPLIAPPPETPDDALPDAVRRSPVGALFLAKGQSVRPGFVPPGRVEWRALAVLCRRLAAAPLALTVAAAMAATAVSETPLTEIATRLPTGTGNALSSIGLAAFWELLEPSEAALLMKLSCFAGGFTLDSALAVAPDPVAASDILAALEERALAQRGSGGRYYLPPPVREQAARMRDAQDKSVRDAAFDAHARCMETLAREFGLRGDTSQERDSFDRLEAEIANLWAAFDYLHSLPINGDAGSERLSLFVYHLSYFLHYRGFPRLQRDWPLEALHRLDRKAKLTKQEQALRPALHWMCATAYLDAEEWETGYVHLTQALELSQENGLECDEADALALQGRFFARARRWKEAITAHKAAMELYRRQGRVQGEVTSLNALGYIAANQKDYATARAHYEEAATLCRRLGDRRGLAVAVNQQGLMDAMEENYAEAARRFEECLHLCRELRYTHLASTALINRGEALLKIGWFEQAASTLALAAALLSTLREPDSSPRWAELRSLLSEVAATSGGAETLTELQSALSRFSVAALLQANPDDPLAPVVRHLQMEPMRLRL